mmetsp:Transcript_7045/g.18173  ORF Transcript_7045/g.18173 Transcript_7045/m.18173 type:complete len:311 (+) Transcript_7045:154-1086(+)
MRERVLILPGQNPKRICPQFSVRLLPRKLDSEEVAGCDLPHLHVVNLVRRRVEDLEVPLETFVQLQHARNVSAPVAIVGCTPDSDELVVEEPLVALHDELVRPGDEGQPVDVVELLADVPTKQITRPSGTETPAGNFLWVAPQQVAHGPLVRHLLLPVDAPDLIDRRDARRQAPVHAQHHPIHQRSQAQIIKHLHAVPPHVECVVLSQALIVEPVNLRDLPRLVVPPYQKYPVRVPHLECQEQEKGFHRVQAPVDEVTHEQVVRARAVAAHFEELQHVEKLPVNVAAYRHGAVYCLHVGLLDQDVNRSQA